MPDAKNRAEGALVPTEPAPGRYLLLKIVGQTPHMQVHSTLEDAQAAMVAQFEEAFERAGLGKYQRVAAYVQSFGCALEGTSAKIPKATRMGTPMSWTIHFLAEEQQKGEVEAV